MNIFKVSAIALATVIALTGCGGSKSSSGSDNKKDKKPESGESRDPESGESKDPESDESRNPESGESGDPEPTPPKRAVYSSPTCLDNKGIAEAGIDLTGITVKEGCINENSTKKIIVLESEPSRWIYVDFSEKLQNIVFTKAVVNHPYIDKKHFKDLIKGDTELTSDDSKKYISAFDNNDHTALLPYATKLRSTITKGSIIRGAVTEIHSNASFSISSALLATTDFSFSFISWMQGSFAVLPGTYKSENKAFDIIVTQETTEKLANNPSDRKVREVLAETFNPRPDLSFKIVIKK